jgi:hypothetical protein
MWMIGYADRRRATPGLGTTLWTAVAVRRGPWITLCVTHRPHPPRPQPTELHPGFPASPTYPLRPCALRLLGLTALFLFERQKSRGEPPRRRRGGRSPHRGRGQRPRLGGISRFRRGALNGHEVPFGGARSALYSAPLAGGLLMFLNPPRRQCCQRRTTYRVRSKVRKPAYSVGVALHYCSTRLALALNQTCTFYNKSA